MTGSGSESEGDETDVALPGVCVVTHPLGSAGENATRTLLDILSTVTAVSLVTAYLPEDSSIRADHEVVEVTGWVDHEEVPAELNDLRLLVMPSEPTEGLPTVILEAMACGTPAYATPVSGVPDVVRERRTGFLMSSRDPDGIAADIEAILDREDPKRAMETFVDGSAMEETAFFRALTRGFSCSGCRVWRQSQLVAKLHSRCHSSY